MNKLVESHLRTHPTHENNYPFTTTPAGGCKRDTSAAAAKKVQPRSNSLKARCLQVIIGQGAKTSDEVAAILNEPILNVRPAMSALVAMGQLIDSGERRVNATGNSMVCWRIRTAEDLAAAFVSGAAR